MGSLRSQILDKLQKTPEEEEELERQLAAIGDNQVTRGIIEDGKDVEELNDEAGLEEDLFEGDIALADFQLDEFQIFDIRNTSRARRQAQKGRRYPTNTWGSNPVISYYIDPSYPQTGLNRAAIQKAIAYWQENTCIQFRQSSSAKDRIKFIYDQGCWSYVGRIGGEQEISIGNGCGSIGTVAHELSHAIGIFHVQSRYDRNDYVLVNSGNINPKMMNNFDIESPSTSDNYGLPYEFGSNMHYGQGDFGLDRSKPALVARSGHEVYQNSMQGRLPTFYDIALVNKYYNCYEKCSSKISCRNGGVQDVNNCNQCLCPRGWSGTTCTERPQGAKIIRVSSSPQDFFAEAGDKKRTESVEFHDNFYILQAPSGKRVELTTKQISGVTSTNCYIGGAEVKFLKDARMSGLKICDPKIRQAPITSEGNTMIINVYNRYSSSQFQFSARAV